MKVPFNDLRPSNESIRPDLEAIFSSGIDKSDFILGQSVKDFERDFAEYIGVKHCMGTGNCTDALEIALESLGICEEDEVIIPAFSVPATASTIVRVGAKPVFTDVDLKTRLINPDLIAEKITAQTKAIVVVHLFGLPVEMSPIVELAKDKNLYLIEDCAQATGASIGGQKVGSFGDVSVFSFYPTKNLGGLGDGGAILTNSDQLSKLVRSICHQRDSTDVPWQVGRNSRLDSLQAEVLRLKLSHLDGRNQERMKIAEKYQSLLDDLGLDFPEDIGDRLHVYHLFTVVLPNREKVRRELEEKGIQTKIHYSVALHQIPIFAEYLLRDQSLNAAEKLSSSILSLPFFPGMEEGQIDFVCTNLKHATSF